MRPPLMSALLHTQQQCVMSADGLTRPVYSRANSMLCTEDLHNLTVHQFNCGGFFLQHKCCAT